MRLIIVGFCLACWSSFTNAGELKFLNGSKLNTYCTSASPVDKRYCEGYIAGAADAFSSAFDMQGIKFFCLPYGASDSQLRLVVAKHLKDNPTALHYSADTLIATALRNGFPCK